MSILRFVFTESCFTYYIVFCRITVNSCLHWCHVGITDLLVGVSDITYIACDNIVIVVLMMWELTLSFSKKKKNLQSARLTYRVHEYIMF